MSKKGRVWTVDEDSGKIGKIFDPGSEENLFPEVTNKAVAWSPDDKFLAGVGSGGKLRVWNTETSEDVFGQLAKKYRKALVLSWNRPSGGANPLLACAGVDNEVFVFDPVAKTIVTQIQQPGWKTGIDWSPRGDKLAIANRRSISIWDVSNPDSPELAGQCKGPSAMVLDLSWSSSQDRIGALAEDGKICIWNANTCAYSAHFSLHERAPYAIQWSPDGKRLASTARHGRIVFQGDQN